MSQRDIRSLDLPMLRAFDALMQERSVSRAAARLFLSQPAVSAALARLREVFGDPLFTRAAHGVVPTPRALALAPQVARLLADAAALLESGETFDPATSSRIFRIASSDYPSRIVLPALGRRLADCGSQVRIVWEPPGNAPLAERLRSGALDLALVARIRRPADMDTEVLYEDHYVHAVRAGHPRAAEALTLDSFCEVPQIFLGYGTSILDDLIDDTLARSGRRRVVQIAVTSFGQILHQLRHSDHAAVLPARVAHEHADELCVRPLPFALPTYLSLLCWSAPALADPGVRWLRDAVRAIVRAASGPGEPPPAVQPRPERLAS